MSVAAAAVLPVTSHKTREAPEMVVMGQGLLGSGQRVEQPSLQPHGGREIRIWHRWRQRRCRRSPPGRTTPAGFAIGSAKSASGERETARPSRAAVALACIDALEEPSAVRASTLQAVRPVVARELDLPALRSWVVRGFPYLVFHVERPADIDVWRPLGTARDIPAWRQEPLED